jgi:hypothetical protein
MLVRIFVALALLTSAAQAQVGQMPQPGQLMPAPGGGGFTGVGDIQSFAWVGLRAYSAADRGTNAINICDPTNTTCIDLATDGTSGALLAPTNVGGTDCTAVNTCTVQTFYGKGLTFCTGSVVCSYTQTTAANRAAFIWSCGNSLPCARGNGTSTSYVSTVTLPSVSATSTMTAVAVRTSAFTTSQAIFTTTGGLSINLNFRQVASAVQMFAGTTGQFIGNIADNKFHALQAVFNGASSVLYCGGSGGVNDTNCSTGGTSNAISPGTISSTGSLTARLLSDGTPAQFLNGDFREFGFVSGTAVDATVAGQLVANQYAYWGPF